MTATYDLIASNVLSSSASSVTFSSIPATYRDLILVMNSATSTNAYVGCRFNSDSGNNYALVVAEGDGSTATSNSSSTANSLTPWNITQGTNTPSTMIVNIMDYSVTDKHKSVLMRYSSTAGSPGTGMLAGRWPNTAAINTVTAITLSGTFNIGSQFHLFGIVS